MAREEYVRWPTTADIPLVLSLVGSDGRGSIGQSPVVSIRRSQETHGGPLDNYYWNGSTFVSTPVWHALTEVDPSGSPGLYAYEFEQTIVGLEIIYSVYYKNEGLPVGFFVENHVVTNEVYIPRSQPDPVLIGPESVMGQLELVKGLLHHNALLDNQTYAGGLLTSARLRMFDHPDHIPANPGGSETSGLLAEFRIDAAYTDGVNTKYTLRRVYP